MSCCRYGALYSWHHTQSTIGASAPHTHLTPNFQFKFIPNQYVPVACVCQHCSLDWIAFHLLFTPLTQRGFTERWAHLTVSTCQAKQARLLVSSSRTAFPLTCSTYQPSSSPDSVLILHSWAQVSIFANPLPGWVLPKSCMRQCSHLNKKGAGVSSRITFTFFMARSYSEFLIITTQPPKSLMFN